MSQFRDAYGEFRRLNAEVVAVSVDSPYAHLAWSRQLRIKFPMASDFNRELCRDYDALAPSAGLLHNIARRTAFVIHASGEIGYAWYAPPDGGFPPIDDILAHVRTVAGDA